jgi:quinol monooxygenase YgiN
MSILLIAEVKVKSEQIDNMKSFMKEILPDTRSFTGNEGIDIYFDTEEKDMMVLIEKWQSVDDYHKYHEWRMSTGVIEKIRSMLDGKPTRRFLQHIDD